MVFALTKQLYRCLLLASPASDDDAAATALPLTCVEMLKALICSVGERAIARVEDFCSTIGFWLACLIYDHKSVEIGG